MAADDSSDLSSLSSLSPAPSDDESDVRLEKQDGILKFFHRVPKPEAQTREPTPPPRKRSPSPEHEYVLADNPDISFIVMFRSRFNEVFPRSLAQFGPQELEMEITDSPPGDRVENFLCALLGLVLNRKQDVKPGHYGRALEDAIQTHRPQWPPSWKEQSPLAGGATFNSMMPTERLTLLRSLVLWSLASSDQVRGAIATSYKQNRQEGDVNQPLSVQPWGSDSHKRRYFLIEGLDDTNFRIYRESNPAGTNRTWWSVAGSIEELKVLADKLDEKDGGPKARMLSGRIRTALPRFETGEEKRKKREYRLARKRAFSRPEPGFSLYEGRTRGKRAKYTFSDDEDDFSSDVGTRRSTRNTGSHTPAEPAGPVTTASGRQVRAPSRMVAGGSAPDSVPGSVQGDAGDDNSAVENAEAPAGRPRRSAAVHHGTNGWPARPTRSRGYNSQDASEEEEDEAGTDFDGDDENDEDEHVPDESEDEEDDYDEDEAMIDDDLEEGAAESRIVKVTVSPSALSRVLSLTPPSSAEKKTKAPLPVVELGEAVPEEGYSALAEMADAPPLAAKGGASAAGLRSPEQEAEEQTPEPVIQSRPPVTPSGKAATSLAFRGSPDKPAAMPRPIDVGLHE